MSPFSGRAVSSGFVGPLAQISSGAVEAGLKSIRRGEHRDQEHNE